jgi:2-polyprenyl-3-methyl-5-hydroxy-6-metoxy-1,4-benzoquinol methylase
MDKYTKDKIYTNEGNAEVLSEVPQSAKTILDIGCGNGDNARLLKVKERRLYGITLSEQEASTAKKYCDAVYVHNLEKGLPEEAMLMEYDVIICSHVLEHIAYPQTLLLNINQVLKKDGVLIVALPNVFHYRSRMQLMAGNFLYKDAGIWDYTHLRWYSFKSAKNLLISNNFQITKAFVSGDLPFLTLLKIIPRKIREVLFRFLAMLSPGLFGVQIVLVSKVLEKTDVGKINLKG